MQAIAERHARPNAKRFDRPYRDGPVFLHHFPALRTGLLSLSPGFRLRQLDLRRLEKSLLASSDTSPLVQAVDESRRTFQLRNALLAQNASHYQPLPSKKHLAE
jgi:hypothetical protein